MPQSGWRERKRNAKTERRRVAVRIWDTGSKASPERSEWCKVLFMMLVIYPVKRRTPTSQCREAEGCVGIKTMHKVLRELDHNLYTKSAGIYVSVII